MTATAESYPNTSALWWADRVAPVLSVTTSPATLGAFTERLLAASGGSNELRRLSLALDPTAGVRLTLAGREDVIGEEVVDGALVTAGTSAAPMTVACNALYLASLCGPVFRGLASLTLAVQSPTGALLLHVADATRDGVTVRASLMPCGAP